MTVQTKAGFVRIQIKSANCALHSDQVERALASLPGIQIECVDLWSMIAYIRYNPDRVSAEDIKQYIQDIGYPAQILRARIEVIEHTTTS